jgi:streptogramin lyase
MVAKFLEDHNIDNMLPSFQRIAMDETIIDDVKMCSEKLEAAVFDVVGFLWFTCSSDRPNDGFIVPKVTSGW